MKELDAPISVGDLIDRITILTIKKSVTDADVEKELDALEKLYNMLDLPAMIPYLRNILLSINEELWGIEDAKRQAERDKKFDQTFIDNARAVYIINDLRATVKRQINMLADSEIVEYKTHENYL